jgi:hypothetical protein
MHYNFKYLEMSSSWEAASLSATQEGSFPCSQEPSTGPYPESNQSSPYHAMLSEISFFNIIHPPMSLTF